MSREHISRFVLSMIAGLAVLLSSQATFGQLRSLNPKTYLAPAPIIPRMHSFPPKSRQAWPEPKQMLHDQKNFALTAEQPFAESLDDAIIESDILPQDLLTIPMCQLNAPCDGYCENDCRCLDQPNDLSSSEVEEAYEEVDDDWAALMTCPCTEHDCDSTGGLQVGPNEPPPANDAEDYCQQLARLLTPTLEAPNLTSQQKQKSLESAMRMIAQKALETADARIAELKIEHQKEIGELKGQLASANSAVKSQEMFESALEPIIANQRRSNDLWDFVSDSTKLIDRKLVSWESRVAGLERKALTMQSRVVVPAAYSRYQDNKPLPQKIDRVPLRPITPSPVAIEPRRHEAFSGGTLSEIQELKRRIALLDQKLKEKNTNSTRSQSEPGKRLEPLYLPNSAPLRPLSQATLQRLNENKR